VIVLDACRPDYFALTEMPNLKELTSRGVSYENAWVGQLLNNTPPAHASLAHGVLPSRSGIIGFSWRDGKTGKHVNPTDWESVCKGELGKILKENNCPGIVGVLKEIAPSVTGASVSGHKFYAAGAMGGHTCDVIAFKSRSEEKGDGAGGKKRQPISIAYVEGKAPCEAALKDESLNVKQARKLGDNAFAIELALSIMKNQKPRVMFINLPETDGRGHQSGGINRPDIMKPVMENTDKLLGKVVQTYKDLGLYEKTIFVITADHGMIPNSAIIDVPEEANKKMKESGMRGEIRNFWYTKSLSDAAKFAETVGGLKILGIHAVYYRVKKDNKYDYELTSPYRENLPKDLDGAYRYLLKTVAFGNGHDIFVMTAEHHAFGKGEPNTRGEHGAVTYNTQHIPLIIAGPGVKVGLKSDYPARIVDVAPTILALFGAQAKNMDGIVLADALEKPDETALKKQNENKEELIKLVNALHRQSEDDLKKLSTASSLKEEPAEEPAKR
jgi:predicted AlkP superfamily pyrophosphatase or phosphodiesterase